MNNDFDQIEKMLAERLRSIDPPGASADAAWDALSAKLPTPKRKRRFFFLFWALLFIATSSTAVYFYNQSSSNGQRLTANGQGLTADGEQLKASGQGLSADGKALNDKAINDKLQVTNDKALNDKAVNDKAVNDKALNDKLQVTSDKWEDASNPELPSPHTKHLTPNPELISPNTKPISPNPNPQTPNPEHQSPNPKPFSPNPELQTPISPRFSLLPLDAGSVIVKNTKSEPVSMADTAPVLPSPWSIKAVLGYNLLSPKDVELADYYPLLGNYIQVSGKYSWTKTYAEAGLQHATWKYGIDYFKTTTDKVLIEDTLLSMVVNAQTGAIISQVYGDTLVNRTITRRVRYNNTFSTIQVPLEFGYYLNKNKWQFEAGLGVNLIYVYKQSGRYLTTDSDITDIVTTNNLGVKQFVIQPQLSFGTNYMILPKWTIGLEAGAALLPSSWAPSGINKNILPLNVGISVVKKF